MPVYGGMIIGRHARPQDLDVNPLKSKHLTNIRGRRQGRCRAPEPAATVHIPAAVDSYRFGPACRSIFAEAAPGPLPAPAMVLEPQGLTGDRSTMTLPLTNIWPIQAPSQYSFGVKTLPEPFLRPSSRLSAIVAAPSITNGAGQRIESRVSYSQVAQGIHAGV